MKTMMLMKKLLVQKRQLKLLNQISFSAARRREYCEQGGRVPSSLSVINTLGPDLVLSSPSCCSIIIDWCWLPSPSYCCSISKYKIGITTMYNVVQQTNHQVSSTTAIPQANKKPTTPPNLLQLVLSAV